MHALLRVSCGRFVKPFRRAYIGGGLSSGTSCETMAGMSHSRGTHELQKGTVPDRGGAIPNSRGLTLVELLVAIAVLAVLVGLSLPALRSVRESAIEVRCIANMQECANRVELYAMDHRDGPPVKFDPALARQEKSIWRSYVNQIYSALPDERVLEYLWSSEQDRTWYCPANQRIKSGDDAINFDYVLSSSWYAASLYLDPAFDSWQGELGSDLQRYPDLFFPASKAVMFEDSVWHGWGGSIGGEVGSLQYYSSRRPGSVAYGDGSAGLQRACDALPHVNRWPIWPLQPFGTTAYGMAGRDR